MKRTLVLCAWFLIQFAAVVWAAEAGGGAVFTLGQKTVGQDGVIRYEIQSPYQSGTPSLRILLPDEFARSDGADVADGYRFLFVLPVESGDGRQYGDGLTAVRDLNLHNLHRLIVIAPTFSQLPWYADHPSRSDVRQESHFVKAVVPAVDRLFPSRRPCRLLLGFSKSGWGAVSLLLRHPDRFDAAAAWDAPLMVESPSRYGMSQVFGTQENFDRCFLPRQWREKAPTLRERKRLAILGYGNFREEMRAAHILLEQLKIPHDYADGPQRSHRWESGWVQQAVESLIKMTSSAMPN
jgi:hypothetical protein